MAEAKKEKIVLYCGDDAGYFQTLELRFKQQYSNLDINVVKLFSNDETSYLSLFVKIIEMNPIIVFMDFSFNTKSFLKLSRQLKRISTLDHVPVVGLIEDKDNLKECWASGVNFTHMKGGDIHDVVYHPMFIALPELVKKTKFAKGKFKKPLEVKLINDFRIGYITPEHIHAEGNFPQKKGDVVQLDSSLDEKIIPSKEFVVLDTDNNDLYYDFKYSYNLSFKFLDEPILNDEDIETAKAMEDPKARENLLKQLKAKRKNSIEEHKDLLRRSKKKHNAWILDKLLLSKPKKTKILIIDKEMIFLNDVKGSLDSNPFTIRLQTVLTEDIRSLRKIFPHIIAMNFINKRFLDSFKKTGLTEAETEALNEELKNRETEALNQVGRMVKRIRATEGYTPFVIIFNCQNYTSKALQNTYEYPLIIASNGDMDLDYILQMAELFENKQTEKYNKKVDEKILALRKEDPVKHGRLNRGYFEEKRYYVSKNDGLSFISTKHAIEISHISETDMTISTEEELTLCSYRLEDPFDCSITLVPADGKDFVKDGPRFVYKAFIHSVSETDKKEIRRYVNETFFEDINAKRKEEMESFNELNKAQQEKHGEQKNKSDDEKVTDLNDSES